MSEITNRYEKLGLREYQFRAYFYPVVCKELSLIMRSVYSEAPKNLQSIMLQDTLAAFRFLPQVETRSGMEAANLLLQAAEVALPKHKRVLAVTEFKHAVVAHKRRHKAQKDIEGSAQLPEDVLIHVFGFLDMPCLAAAGLVCWSWNSAANDNKLWESQYEIFFEKEGMDLVAIEWREKFKQTYIGNSSRRFTSNRGYCSICKLVVWLCKMKCPNHGIKIPIQQIKPVSPQQVVEYLLKDSFSADTSSDSDSDSDQWPSLKLWSYATLW